MANLESKKKVSGDALLYAVGRQGNVDELNLPAAGIEADGRGRIPVDSDYRTKQPHIFCRWRCDRISQAWLRYPWSRAVLPPRIAFGVPVHTLILPTYPYGIYTIPGDFFYRQNGRTAHR